MPELQLLKPDVSMLASYRQALERGWSPDNVDGAAAAQRELAQIAADPAAFVETLDDPEAKGPPIRLPDGSTFQRLPSFRRWLWDGEFAGSFGLRWRPGTSALPDHVPGHIGYTVPAWKAGLGYATRGLALLLPMARAVGLSHVELVTEPDNLASQKVILNNGGALVGRFENAALFHGGPALRFRIDLAGS
ncbi:MAG: GNAT family N-acetyltransferase [Phenylobacterium sp.]|jgi:predicted acetyltransferase|uniref:GNAT family N-acetyltransferase n=1 Tax=Phenylobacterium sp. TaxID=1871053 RepID=UPI002A360AC6|nr:GNAT family N-acetyltransferase [Phenylobacterium sp.]MDX9997053.1 GNAT family N-acetyltransferase [Phenylobacterium sp.]